MNFCSKCGSTIMPGSNVCQNCGEPVIFNTNAMAQPMIEQPIPTPEVQMPIGTNVPLAPVLPVNQGLANAIPMPPEVNIESNMAPTVEVPVTIAPQVPVSPEIPVNQGLENAVLMPPEVNIEPNVAPTIEVPVTAVAPQVPVSPEIPANQGLESAVPMPPAVNIEPNMAPTVEVPATAIAPQVPVSPEIPVNQGLENAVPMPPEVNIEPNMASTVEVPATAIAPQVPVSPENPVNQGLENAVPNPPSAPLDPNQVVELPKAEAQKESKKPKKEKSELTNEEKEKKFNKITTIVVIVVSIIAMALMGFFMYKALFVKEEENGIQIKNATQYNYEGFEFYLPEGTTASVEDGLFIVKATDNSWSAIITIQEGSYNTLVSNKSQISGYFEDLGYVSGEAVENEVSGMGFVTTEVLIGSQNVLVAYAKASGTKVYGILYVNELSTYDNYSLKTVGEILASGNNSGELTSMPAGFTVEMFEQTFEVAR